MNNLGFADTMQEMRGAVHLEVYKAGNLSLQTMTTTSLWRRPCQAGPHAGGGTRDTSPRWAWVPAQRRQLQEIRPYQYGESQCVFCGICQQQSKIQLCDRHQRANGLAIREFGLFFGDGTLFSRRVRKSTIGKEDDIQITGYWEIYF
ncbi:hypothetical protein [Selenomonas sp. AB3002]|uniref:hypothetical protein n=1 Tax=Selenomonas sp. AB3002 TaxID=1392502 RepID=UPI000495791F